VRRLALVVALAALAACTQSAQQSQAVLIGAIYPLSGPQANGGKDELTGVKAALQLATGELGGRDVRLQVVDAETPAAAVSAVDRLHAEGAAAIIGTYGSTLADAASARADQLHTVYWETGAVADDITVKRHWVFRTVATGSTLGRMAVEFTSKVLIPAGSLQPAAARAVIVHVNDVYGESVSKGELSRASQLGIHVVDDIAYNPLAFDPVQLVSSIAADHPDYLWDVSYLDDGVAIWSQVVRSSLQLRGAVGTSSAFCMPDFGRRLGQQAIGVYAADKPDADISASALTPAGRSLLARARHAYSALAGQQQMSISAVAGFVGGWTLFHEVLPKISGDVTPESIRETAFRVDLPVGSMINGGGVQFAPSGTFDAGQNRRAAAVVGQWQAEVQMRIVYPAGYATASPVINP
jgi:branched-chain amino acid transport system substrate-binding protein